MYLERIFQQDPHQIAVCQGDIRYTYGQLYAEAQQLAAFLKESRGPLLVFGHKHPRMIVSLLACLLSGRAWVPCDSSLPAERIHRIMEFCGAEQLFYAEDSEIDAKIPSFHWSDVPFSDECFEFSFCKERIAYIMFTSGSTGTPKGIPISCGYLGSAEQMEQVEWVFDRLSAPGCLKIIDPAMADHGKLYAGFDDAFVEAMKRFCTKADWLLPNLTEACLLTGSEYRTNYDRHSIETLLKKLSGMGCKGIILTGVSFEEATTGVMVWEQGGSTCYQHERLEQNCHGTGDLFAAAFTGALAKGKAAAEAVKLAADYTLACMRLTAAENTRPYGIMFEPLLGELIRALQR